MNFWSLGPLPTLKYDDVIYGRPSGFFDLYNIGETPRTIANMPNDTSSIDKESNIILLSHEKIVPKIAPKICKNRKILVRSSNFRQKEAEFGMILYFSDFNTCINVSYVMQFLAWWVLKSNVFAQKSTVFKWNCCIL